MQFSWISLSVDLLVDLASTNICTEFRLLPSADKTVHSFDLHTPYHYPAFRNAEILLQNI